MANIVKLYRVTTTKAFGIDEQGTGFSLTPWSSNSGYYEGYDDGGQDYVLPDGFEVAEAVMGELAIFDTNGNYYQITRRGNTPVLVTASEQIYLKKAEEN